MRGWMYVCRHPWTYVRQFFARLLMYMSLWHYVLVRFQFLAAAGVLHQRIGVLKSLCFCGAGIAVTACRCFHVSRRSPKQRPPCPPLPILTMELATGRLPSFRVWRAWKLAWGAALSWLQYSSQKLGLYTHAGGKGPGVCPSAVIETGVVSYVGFWHWGRKA